MQHYEYTVIPAPGRAEKHKGAKTGADRYAATLADLINAKAAEGWEFQRAETLPAEERTGLTGKTTVYHNLLVFRRARDLEPAQEAGQPVTGHAAPANEDAPAGKKTILVEAPEGAAPKLRASRGD
ncbi:DUF4177 domain-containing protein [Pseudothioclava nitratireducens]|jgi:hypothetical protein|uniref:DUF4177 domain-containing protein n=1 Tax=Pseudothioclava nitratireducens TaxID=1928646 RepID=UPI0023DB20E4|nr:DUF4177 domain-containing protein [Defluviimonas nitratireducens]MDF1620124.1 DUF4177 domain-containing protein [Defluviimonas nitratireducens]